MQKKLAVLVRDRQGEAIRMSAGLILADDAVDVYILDRKLEATEANAQNIELLKDMEQKVFTNSRENPDIEYVSTEEIAKRLPGYDNIIPY